MPYLVMRKPLVVRLELELAWRSGSVMDCHATAWGSIPSGNGVKPSFTSFARDSKWGAVSK